MHKDLVKSCENCRHWPGCAVQCNDCVLEDDFQNWEPSYKLLKEENALLLAMLDAEAFAKENKWG